MEIKIINEAGCLEAIEGMRYSFALECPLTRIPGPDWGASYKRAERLANLDGGHNKFLESIFIWVDIRGSLKWWKHFDTYRVGVTKLSKSTMHTLMKRPVQRTDFSMDLPKVFYNHVNKAIEDGDFERAVALLPSCYLQTKRVCMNYKALRTIIKQRKTHKMLEWRDFCEFMETGVKHPELLGDI